MSQTWYQKKVERSSIERFGGCRGLVKHGMRGHRIGWSGSVSVVITLKKKIEGCVHKTSQNSNTNSDKVYGCPCGHSFRRRGDLTRQLFL